MRSPLGEPYSCQVRHLTCPDKTAYCLLVQRKHLLSTEQLKSFGNAIPQSHRHSQRAWSNHIIKHAQTVDLPPEKAISRVPHATPLTCRVGSIAASNRPNLPLQSSPDCLRQNREARMTSTLRPK